MKALIAGILIIALALGQDPVEYYFTNMFDMARKYRLHFERDDQKYPVRIKSIREADSLLAIAEAFAGTVPDSLHFSTNDVGPLDSFYRNPYKIKYIRDHHLVTTHKRFYGNAIDSLK